MIDYNMSIIKHDVDNLLKNEDVKVNDIQRKILSNFNYKPYEDLNKHKSQISKLNKDGENASMSVVSKLHTLFQSLVSKLEEFLNIVRGVLDERSDLLKKIGENNTTGVIPALAITSILRAIISIKDLIASKVKVEDDTMEDVNDIFKRKVKHSIIQAGFTAIVFIACYMLAIKVAKKSKLYKLKNILNVVYNIKEFKRVQNDTDPFQLVNYDAKIIKQVTILNNIIAGTVTAGLLSTMFSALVTNGEITGVTSRNALRKKRKENEKDLQENDTLFEAYIESSEIGNKKF